MSIRVEVMDDGSLHYISDGPVVITGPVTGNVVVDGERVNVAPAVIEVASEAQAAAVAEAIAVKLEVEGHPDFLNDPSVPDDGFTHIPAES